MIDFSKLKKTPNGRLIASTLAVGVCPACHDTHVEFRDPDGNPFAIAYLPHGTTIAVAADLMECAGEIEAMTGARKTS